MKKTSVSILTSIVIALVTTFAVVGTNTQKGYAATKDQTFDTGKLTLTKGEINRKALNFKATSKAKKNFANNNFKVDFKQATKTADRDLTFSLKPETAFAKCGDKTAFNNATNFAGNDFKQNFKPEIEFTASDKNTGEKAWDTGSVNEYKAGLQVSKTA